MSAKDFKMPKEMGMSAYYYSFELTGVREIDEILSAVAMAGDSHHHTDCWADVYCSDGFSAAELIQEMANRAAEKLRE